MTIDYKAAYERQKRARAMAEEALENKSRELYDSHQSLMSAYTKLKHQKEQILHQEKLASIGELSAGIAHEINNPAGFVKSNLLSLKGYIATFKEGLKIYQNFYESSNFSAKSLADMQSRLTDLDLDYLVNDVDDLLADSVSGTERIEIIVENLKRFARPDSDSDEDVEINECVQNTLKLVQSSIKYKAELNLDLHKVPVIKGRAGALSQVMLNLLTNAVDAVEKNGVITVATKSANDFVSISISDNGCGIPANELGRIFDPFYTTKGVGVGTGLGLSISHGIVKQHSGTLSVVSTMNKGTTFTIDLPLARE